MKKIFKSILIALLFIVLAVGIAAGLFFGITSLFDISLPELKDISLPKLKEDLPSADDFVVDGKFDITPVNNTSGIAISVYSADSYSDNTLTENMSILKVDTGSYNGDIVWALRIGNEYGDVPDSMFSITAIDSRIYLLTCLQPFGYRYTLAARLADFPDITAECVLDYTQRYYFDHLTIGFNTYLADGSIGRSGRPGYPVGFLPVTPFKNRSKSLNYFAQYASTLYTIESPVPANCPSLSVEFVVNESWVTCFGLEDYKFKSYSFDFNNSLSGVLEGFFDKSWFEYGVSENGKTIDDFAGALLSASYYDENLYMEVGIDIIPAYTLIITGLPETTQPFYYDVYFDIYDGFLG
ncbi:MAG: hypothetical protein J1F61_00780 [Clostridiales bacterium]|nr:hypothetical protein [Clostridiales bacterium]